MNMKKLLFILMSVLAFLGVSTVCAQEAYTKITSADELVEDGVYLIATAEYGVALGMNFTNNAARETAQVTILDGVISTEVATAATDKLPYEIVLKKNGENWALYDLVNQKYIARTTADENRIQNQDDPYGWKITIDAEGNADIVSLEATARRILYMIGGSGSARFSAYKTANSTNKVVQLYKKGGEYVDETAPKVDKILTKSDVPTSIDVYFNESVTKESAEVADNYSIEGLAITAATLAEGNKMVTLTTAAMTAGTKYTLVINNVEDAAGNKMENVSTEFSFGYAEVADLAALCAMRDSYVEGQKYLVKGEVVITAIVGKNGSNQTTINAWVQDKGCDKAVGHSMMLYYVNDLLPEGAKVGDVLSGLVGELTVYNDLLEMQYFDTTMIELTGETAEITVDDVTISDLLGKDKLSYPNAMVRIKGVRFAETGNFAENTSYNITDENTSIIFRTNREGSYLGEKIPEGTVDVTAYVGYYQSKCQISPRSKEDISSQDVANESRERIEYTVYPNPTEGLLNVETEGNFRVSVYSLNGVSLIRHNACEKAQLDLSGLNQGVYIVEIATDKGTTYTKVVVR